ncbi:MAG TPA: hypothetical protein VF183_07115 [Acidimicrobiales bacterium]|jgi:hypothetical protein|nr:hypothetical protein [Acidimicrobiia bacterium]
MTDVGYVAAAWSITGAAMVAYAVRVMVRTRRAERSLPDGDPRR